MFLRACNFIWSYYQRSFIQNSSGCKSLCAPNQFSYSCDTEFSSLPSHHLLVLNSVCLNCVNKTHLCRFESKVEIYPKTYAFKFIISSSPHYGVFFSNIIQTAVQVDFCFLFIVATMDGTEIRIH